MHTFNEYKLTNRLKNAAIKNEKINCCKINTSCISSFGRCFSKYFFCKTKICIKLARERVYPYNIGCFFCGRIKVFEWLIVSENEMKRHFSGKMFVVVCCFSKIDSISSFWNKTKCTFFLNNQNKMHIFLIASSRHKIRFVLFQDLDHTHFSEYSWSSFCKSFSLSISMRNIYVCACSSFAYQNRKFAAINFWKTNRHWKKNPFDNWMLFRTLYDLWRYSNANRILFFKFWSLVFFLFLDFVYAHFRHYIIKWV